MCIVTQQSTSVLSPYSLASYNLSENIKNYCTIAAALVSEFNDFCQNTCNVRNEHFSYQLHCTLFFNPIWLINGVSRCARLAKIINICRLLIGQVHIHNSIMPPHGDRYFSCKNDCDTFNFSQHMIYYFLGFFE